MTLSQAQKHLAAMLAQRKPDVEYMIQLSENPEFAADEIAENKESLKEALLKEKQNHLSHIEELNMRLEKIENMLGVFVEMVAEND